MRRCAFQTYLLSFWKMHQRNRSRAVDEDDFADDVDDGSLDQDDLELWELT